MRLQLSQSDKPSNSATRHSLNDGPIDTAAFRSQSPPIELRLRSLFDWHEALHRHLLPLDCDAAEPLSFECQAVIGRLRGMIVAEFRIDASTLERRLGPNRNGDIEYVKIVYQLAGRSRVQQGRNRATLEAGGWTVCDAAREYLIDMSRGTRMLLILVPRSHCPGWLPAVNALAAQSLGAGGPGIIALAALTARLREVAPLDRHSEGLLQDLVIALIERALAIELEVRGMKALGKGVLALPQLHAYILQHLADPTLTLVRVASLFCISRRSLYNLFIPSGTTPHAFILHARLQCACALLNDPNARATAIASIARQCGFTDPAHFTRAFHARYGVAPTAWRRRPTRLG